MKRQWVRFLVSLAVLISLTQSKQKPGTLSDVTKGHVHDLEPAAVEKNITSSRTERQEWNGGGASYAMGGGFPGGGMPGGMPDGMPGGGMPGGGMPGPVPLDPCRAPIWWCPPCKYITTSYDNWCVAYCLNIAPRWCFCLP